MKQIEEIIRTISSKNLILANSYKREMVKNGYVIV